MGLLSTLSNYINRNSNDMDAYENRIKTAKPTAEGLYPPEIVAIEFCERHPDKNGNYPGWYWYDYGIRNVALFQESLAKRGYIEKGVNGKWTRTSLGEQVVNDNQEIVYAHRHHLANMDAWCIQGVLNNVKLPFSGTWRDKYWAYLEHEKLISQTQRDLSYYRGLLMDQADFLKYEHKYGSAADIYQKIIELDQASGDFKDCPQNAAPGIISELRKCRNKAMSEK